ncbi:hypothetical protein BJ741DRAFT_621701 [Chytriomyces cf. hyalinus JEL632]|nr:hypothetical protein BJ741DRAFT_621701 [Chytriomyces cf. hyalinus JEL632]
MGTAFVAASALAHAPALFLPLVFLSYAFMHLDVLSTTQPVVPRGVSLGQPHLPSTNASTLTRNPSIKPFTSNCLTNASSKCLFLNPTQMLQVSLNRIDVTLAKGQSATTAPPKNSICDPEMPVSSVCSADVVQADLVPVFGTDDLRIPISHWIQRPSNNQMSRSVADNPLAFNDFVSMDQLLELAGIASLDDVASGQSRPVRLLGGTLLVSIAYYSSNDQSIEYQMSAILVPASPTSNSILTSYDPNSKQYQVSLTSNLNIVLAQTGHLTVERDGVQKVILVISMLLLGVLVYGVVLMLTVCVGSLFRRDFVDVVFFKKSHPELNQEVTYCPKVPEDEFKKEDARNPEEQGCQTTVDMFLVSPQPRHHHDQNSTQQSPNPKVLLEQPSQHFEGLVEKRRSLQHVEVQWFNSETQREEFGQVAEFDFDGEEDSIVPDAQAGASLSWKECLDLKAGMDAEARKSRFRPSS